MVKLFFVLLLCLASQIHASEQQKAIEQNIIVEAITNNTSDPELDPLSEGFADLLVSYLSAYKNLKIIYREDLHKIWQELSQSRSGLSEIDTLQIGRLIQANKVVKGGFVKVKDSFKVNIHIFDIQTTQLQDSFEENGRIENIGTFAASLAKKIAHKLLNANDIHEPEIIDAQSVINTHFMKGLGYFYSGLYEHAVAKFMQVSDLDQSNADARFWLGKSYLEGGSKSHAKIEFQRFLEDFPNHKNSLKVKILYKSLLNLK